MIVVQAVFECWECKDLKRLFLWVIGKKLKCKNCGWEIEIPNTLSLSLSSQGGSYIYDN